MMVTVMDGTERGLLQLYEVTGMCLERVICLVPSLVCFGIWVELSLRKRIPRRRSIPTGAR